MTKALVPYSNIQLRYWDDGLECWMYKVEASMGAFGNCIFHVTAYEYYGEHTPYYDWTIPSYITMKLKSRIDRGIEDIIIFGESKIPVE